MVTTGDTPRTLTAKRQKAIAMRNWKMSFMGGVRPKDWCLSTLDASSTKPRAPVSRVAARRSHCSQDPWPTSTTEMATPTNMMRPPMVGVPCLTRWVAGPSSRTSWPMWSRFKMRMKPGMKAMVAAAATTMARKSRNEG